MNAAAQSRFTRWQNCTLQTRALGLLDLLCRIVNPACVVDLGARGQGRGRIDGGYLRYLLHNQTRRGIAVDLDGDGMTGRSHGFHFVAGDINSPATIDEVERLGPPDTALLFNVLLHQLDWRQTLSHWSHLPCLCLFGPAWNEPESVRLLDQGRDWFHENILLPLKGEANYHGAIAILDGPDPYNRLELWQWGISRSDLENHLTDLGYHRLAAVDFGPHEAIGGFSWQGHVVSREAAQ